MTDETFSGLPTGGPRDLGPGSRLGAYVLETPLGRGGMGQVWKATDGKRSVAIKLLPPEFRGNASAMAQVEEAFHVVHALTHEHICKTLGLFNDPVYGPYLVMDFIGGITLSEYQRKGGFPKGRVPLEQVGEILRPVAKALDYSHRKVIQLANGTEHEGVLHRDVKPDNILLVLCEDRIREVWLIDFGLAAEIRNTMTKHTNKSVDTRGTRPYMSPEQIKGKRHQWDGRTDQYSLAVVAYQLLSGHLPFDGDDEFSLMLAISQEPADLIPNLADHVNAAVLKGLSKNKDDRFANCVQMADALTATAPAPVVTAPKVVVPAPPAAPKNEFGQGTQAGERKAIKSNGMGLGFRWCPPGKFTMGSPPNEPGRSDDEQQVQVELTKGFWMQETVVTQSLWTSVMETKPWIEHGDKDYYNVGPSYPAVDVNHLDATAFCDELTKIDRAAGRLPSGAKYALPTEAQWEYACRAGTKTAYSYGDDEGRLGQHAWFDKNVLGIGEKYAHEVAKKKPNPWGLYDMQGNVLAWCRDTYEKQLAGGRDPVASSGSYRVSRGGSCYDPAIFVRCSNRNYHDPADRYHVVGFRVVLELSDQPDTDNAALLLGAATTQDPMLESARPSATRDQATRVPPPVTRKASKTEPALLSAPFSAAHITAARRQWSAHLAQPETITTPSGSKMMLIPPGEFSMGGNMSPEDVVAHFEKLGCGTADASFFKDELPSHRVKVTRPFWMAEHPVTVGEFQAFVSATGHRTTAEKEGGGITYNVATKQWEQRADCLWWSPGFTQTDRHPVVVVSHGDAVSYCQWLSQQLGHVCRLPWEAEWEYAARAGTTSLFFHGDAPEGLTQFANVADASLKKQIPDWPWVTSRGNDGHPFTSPVGSFTANPFGLRDVLGNCSEWCGDWHAADYYSRSPVENPTGAPSGSSRVLRGGSWSFNAILARCSYRDNVDPAYRNYGIGFRVVVEL